MYNAMDILSVTMEIIISSKINLWEKEEKADAKAWCFRENKTERGDQLETFSYDSCSL